jgi:rhodanese-related sulfurtransferase
MPLQEIPQRMDEIKTLLQPLVLCCASGNRSQQAYRYLVQHGIACCNGGAWPDVNYFHAQTV